METNPLKGASREQVVAWINELPTIAAIDIIVDAYELVALDACPHNGGTDGGEVCRSDFECLDSVYLSDVMFYKTWDRDISVFNVLDAARAQLKAGAA